MVLDPKANLLFDDLGQIASGMFCMTPRTRDKESFGMILHRKRYISQRVMRKK